MTIVSSFILLRSISPSHLEPSCVYTAFCIICARYIVSVHALVSFMTMICEEIWCLFTFVHVQLEPGDAEPSGEAAAGQAERLHFRAALPGSFCSLSTQEVRQDEYFKTVGQLSAHPPKWVTKNCFENFTGSIGVVTYERDLVVPYLNSPNKDKSI